MIHFEFIFNRLKSWYILMFQCPWIPELINRFGDMHMLFDDALIKQINLEGNRGARERYRSIDVDKRGPTSILQEHLVTE